MECAEARDHLVDLNQGRLEAETAASVRAHVARCPECAAAFHAQARIRALIQTRLPRYPAPDELRARIRASAARPQSTGWRAWWSGLRTRPWAVGSLAGAAALVVLVWAGLWWVQPDPASQLLRRAVAEHSEYMHETMRLPAPDPQAILTQLRTQVNFPLMPLFRGDPQVQLVIGRMSRLSDKQAATLVYRDTAGHYTTLFMMPEKGTAIPEGDRLQIETFKPYHRVLSGRQVLLWKQANLACVIVSDLGESGVAQMFLKIRTAG
jgi:anti-sigma factor (TIGR02949 family)